MQRSIAPELVAMLEAYPEALNQWIQHIGVDICICADSPIVTHLSGWSINLDIGACKIVCPSGKGAQQSNFLGIPLLMHDGGECHQSLRDTLGRMLEQGHLGRSVVITYK
jgi:hypothetical protein